MRLIQLLTSSVAEPVRLGSALAPGDNKQKFASKEALRFVKKKNVNEKETDFEKSYVWYLPGFEYFSDFTPFVDEAGATFEFRLGYAHTVKVGSPKLLKTTSWDKRGNFS